MTSSDPLPDAAGQDSHVYPVGLLSDWQHRKMRSDGRRYKMRRGRKYLRHQIRRRNWRAVRNYFNGYLAEHDGHPHNAGRGWTKRAALRRVDRLCREPR